MGDAPRTDISAFGDFYPLDLSEVLEAPDQAGEDGHTPLAARVHELETKEILRACAPAATVRLRAGEFLFREGEEARYLYVVKRGRLRIVSGGTVYETVKAGGIVGEMAIIEQIEQEVPRSASVIAGTDAELAAIDVDQFQSLIINTPSFALTVMRLVTRRLRVMNQRFRAGR